MPEVDGVAEIEITGVLQHCAAYYFSYEFALELISVYEAVERSGHHILIARHGIGRIIARESNAV